MTSAPRSARCMPTPPGPRSALSMMRTPARRPAVESVVVIAAAVARRARARHTLRRLAASAQHPAARDRAAAVYREQGAGDELALAAGQVDDGVGHVVGIAQPGQVHRLELRTSLGGHARVAPLVDDVADGDRVAADRLLAVLDRDRPCEGVESALAGDVGREAGA